MGILAFTMVYLSWPALAGNSVCTFVHGFEPYFYVEAPNNFSPDDCDSLAATFNVRRAGGRGERVERTCS